MLDVDAITAQVLENCVISDSRHAGLYSVCGLALRLRDLYKWERGLEPWAEEDPSLILQWIGQKEEQWETFVEREFARIEILGREHDPFDARTINALLEPHGFIYGAGYVQGLRPTFFLAVLEEKKSVDGHPVYILGRELARDLLTLPALSQDDCILIRKEAAKLFLWDQIFFIKKSGRLALRFALERYRVDAEDTAALRRSLARISAEEIEGYIYHELGEIKETRFDRLIWRDMVATFPHTPIELLARTVKDVLADTNAHGRLRHIVKERKTASLALYVAFLDGLRRSLLPELASAFQGFVETRDWRPVEQAISAGYDRAKSYAETMSHVYMSGKQRDDMAWVKREMEQRLLVPLGICHRGADVEGENEATYQRGGT